MSRSRPQWPLLTLLLAPALVLFTVFVIIPVFQAAVFSLYRWNGLGPMEDFKGWNNFALLFQNTIFSKALAHNFIIVVVSLVIELPLALAAALALADRSFPLAVLFRTLFFLPYVLSEVITGVLWQFVFHPQFGLMKGMLANPDTLLIAIVIVIIWKYFGFHMTILLAGLQDIPHEITEAARIDGAGEVQTLRRIVLPLLKPTILVSVFFSVVGSFQLFDVVWAMGKGDPVNAGETMVTFLYKFGIQRLNIGFGGAVAVTIFVICLAFSLLYAWYTSRMEKADR